MPDKLSFVIPCFNNEENIDDLFNALFENEKQFPSASFEYILIDDASEDATLQNLNTWQERFPKKISILPLKKNIGSHKAVFKGLLKVSGDCIIVMAADLQDPPELTFQLFNAWKNGSSLVIAVKENQQFTYSSRVFHFVMRSLIVKKAPEAPFDFVLFDKGILTELLKPSIKNCNLFYRLIEVGTSYSTLGYEKKRRKKGKSGWTFSKKLFFFIENLLSYSISKAGIIK